MTTKLETSPPRVALGLLSGAVVGAAVFWAGAVIVYHSPFTQPLHLAEFLSLTAVTGVFWLAGLVARRA